MTPAPKSYRQPQGCTDATGSSPRHTGCVPRSFSHPSLSLFLLLLVGFLRPLHPLLLRPHQTLYACHQLLGRWSFGPSLLADFLPVRCREAANHDRSTRWCVKGWEEAFSKVEGRGDGDMATGWTKRLLEGVFAVFLESLPRECCCTGCIRGSYERPS